MGKAANDPLAGKSRALKSALEAVERLGAAADRRAVKPKDAAVKLAAPRSTGVPRPVSAEPAAPRDKPGPA